MDGTDDIDAEARVETEQGRVTPTCPETNERHAS